MMFRSSWNDVLPLEKHSKNFPTPRCGKNRTLYGKFLAVYEKTLTVYGKNVALLEKNVVLLPKKHIFV